MPRSDFGHDLTEIELGKVQRRIEQEFSAASKDMEKTAAEYFKKFEKRDAAMLKQVEEGSVSAADYRAWRIAQIGRGKRLESMAAQLAERATNASEAAIAYGNDTMAAVYAINRNYAAYTIERSGANIDFNLLDEHTVKRLAVYAPDLMPYYPEKKAVNRGINLAYGKQQVTKIVNSGILQGLSVPQMAKNLAKTLSKMEMVSATRAVRTACTGAENGGRLDSYESAGKMGIKMEKEWMCTLDGRTRDSHRDLDGTHVPPDKKFSNGLMYPADPSGAPHEVYNCRCTMVAWFPEIEGESNKRVTYHQWEKGKQGRNGKGLSEDQWTGIGEKSTINAAEYRRMAEELVKPKKAAPKNVDFNKLSNFNEKLGDDYCDTLSGALNNCGNDTAIGVFQKYGEEVKIVNPNAKGGAFFKISDGGITLNAQAVMEGDRINKPLTTFFHEAAHNIDWLAGGKGTEYYSMSFGNGAIRQALEKDYKELKRLAKEKFGRCDKKHVILFAKELSEEMYDSYRDRKIAFASASDVLEGLTGVSFPLGTGHGAAYHKTEGATVKEFFAECYAGVTIDKDSYSALQALFPNATAVFAEALEGLL